MRKLAFLSSSLFSLLALSLSAQVTTTNVYWSLSLSSATPSGTWETTSWSINSSGTPLSAWVDTAPGNFPEFSAGSAATGSYTVTANANHTIAGMLVNTTTGTVTIGGTGVLSLASGVQGFFSSGTLLINSAIGGTGGIKPQSGTLDLYGNNTYSGGTMLDGTLVYFNNNNSFGTGPITPVGTSGSPTFSAMLTPGTAAITLANPFVISTAENGLNFVPVNYPLISTGNWDLQNTVWVRNNGTAATTTLTLAGVLSDVGGINFSANNNGSIIVSGANTFTGPITVGGGNSAVTLVVGADNNFGAIPGSFTPAAITLGNNTAGVILASNSFQLNANRGITLGADSTLEAASSQTFTVGGAIAGGNNMFFGAGANTGTVNLTGVNTYSGNTTINAGSLAIGGAGDLGDTGGSGGNYGGSITVNGSFVYSSSTSQALSGSISGTGTVTQNGPGALTMNNYNYYTGATYIAGGTLYLSGGGTLNDTAIDIAAGATFDVSAQGGYYLNSGSLGASGTSTPARLNGASGGSINLSSQEIALTYDGQHAPLTITYNGGSGTLFLNGNPFAVINASGTPLGTGTYPMILTSGTISGNGNYYVGVGGNGLATGKEALIQISGNGANVNLIVQAAPTSAPVWNGADSGNNNNWSDPANWVNNTAPDTNGDKVNFNGSTGLNPNMDQAYDVFSLTFSNTTTGEFTLTSAGYTLGVVSGVTNNSALPQAIDMPVELLDMGTGPSAWAIPNSAASITLGSPISDEGNGLALTGSGTLQLSANNTFSGGLTAGSGSTVQLIGDLGDNGSGSGFYAGVLTVNGTFLDNSSTAQTFAGAVSISGVFFDQAYAAQTFSGALTINPGGTFSNAASVVPTWPASITDNGTLNFSSSVNQSLTTPVTGSGSLVQDGTGTSGQGQLTMAVSNSYTGITVINNALLQINPSIGDSGFGTPPATLVANQITFNTSMNSGANNFGLVDTGGNPSSFTLNANRGIFLGANGGAIATYPGATFSITGPITGTGPLYVGNSLANYDGYVHFSGISSYTGPTIISGGWLFLDTNNCLPAGTSVTIGSSHQAVGYGSFLNMNGFNQTIGPLASSPGFGETGLGTPAVEFGSTASVLTILQTNITTTFAGGIGYDGANGSLIVTVPSGGTGGTLILVSNNTYTGTTTLSMSSGASSGPTLALASTAGPPASWGALSNTTSMFIGAGATLDVSQLSVTGPTYYWSSATTLNAGGAGTSLHSTAAAINGASGGTVNLGSVPITLNFTPTSFSSDTAHPALYMPQGTLTLNNNIITVTNAAASPLGAGTYRLIQTSGTISGSPVAWVNVAGSGVAGGQEAYLQVNGGNVNLVVQPPPQSDVWNGGDFSTSPNWSVGGSGGNWSGAAAPDTFGDAVTFAGTVGLIPVMNGNYEVDSLTFASSAGAFFLTNSGGSVLTVGSGVTNNSTIPQTLSTPVVLQPLGSITAASQWNVANVAGTLTVNSNISDVGYGLAVSGAGSLILKGSNIYSGPTIVGSGASLIVSNTGELTSGSTGGTYASAITVNGTFNYSGTNSQVLSGVISGSGGIVLDGYPYITSGNYNLTLSGANTYTGPTTINGGLLQINSDARLGAAPASAVANQLTLNCSTTNGLRCTASFALSTTRGITLGANGGSIHAASGDTVTYAGVITGPGSFSSGSGDTLGYGTIQLSGANNYAGATTVAAGTLQLGASGTLPSGTPVTIASDQSAGSVLDLNSFSQTIGPLASSTGIGGAGTKTPTLKLSGALTVIQTNVNTAFAGVISGTGGSLTINGNGTGELLLGGTNTYTGATTISTGAELGLTGKGAISNTPSITIAAGGTFDVSQLTATTFFLSASTTLNANGSGTSVGSSAASLKGATTVNLDAQPVNLTFTPASLNGDTTHPALYVSQGALTFNGNVLSINNAASGPLGAGTYVLIQVAGGSINNAPGGTVNITGKGLAAACTASIQISGGNVNLVVVSTLPPTPVINSVMHSGSSVILSGTNGPDSGTYYVLTSTNLALPLVQWTPVSTNSFSATGTFSVTNTASQSPDFFIIATPK